MSANNSLNVVTSYSASAGKQTRKLSIVRSV